jgi:hypothetical protein
MMSSKSKLSSNSKSQPDKLRIAVAQFLNSLDPLYKDEPLLYALRDALKPFLPGATTLGKLPKELLSQIAVTLDYKNAQSLSSVISFDDKGKLRSNGTLLKIEQLADLIISEISQLPIPTQVDLISDWPLASIDLVTKETKYLYSFNIRYILKGASKSKGIPHPDTYFVDLSKHPNRERKIGLAQTSLKQNIVEMFAVADREGFDVSELFAKKHVYVCGDDRVQPCFTHPDDDLLKINIGRFDNTFKHENITELIDRTKLMCEKLNELGIISYKTIHEVPELAAQERDEPYPPLCVPWTDIINSKGGAGGIYKKTTMKEVGKDGVSRLVYIKGKTRYVKRRCPDGTYKYSPLRTK